MAPRRVEQREIPTDTESETKANGHKPASLIATLVDLRSRQIQKARIQFGNRTSAIERGADEASDSQEKIVRFYLGAFADLETQITNHITKLVKAKPIYKRASKIKGVGPMMAAYLIAFIDIEKADTVSALWRYAGYGVVNGEREKPVKGEKLHYNARLKTGMYLLAGQFLKANSPYARVYEEAKPKYALAHPDWTKLHCHLAAQRKMIKLFLSHLWEVWRKQEGLSVVAPWAFSNPEWAQAHRHIPPEDFGW